jgi:hypothetical protein
MRVYTEIYAVLWCYAANSDYSLPSFRDNLSLAFSKVLTLDLLKQLVVSQLVKKKVRILWKHDFYWIHRSPPPVRALNQVNPDHDRPSYSFKVQLNSILSFTPRSSKWPLSFRFPHQSHLCIYLLPSTCHMPRFSVNFFMLSGFKLILQ